MALSDLSKSTEVEVAEEVIRLTTRGADAARALLDDARSRLLNGRRTFYEELKRGLSGPLSDDAFDLLWVRLQDGLAELFHREGMAVVRAILDPSPDNAGSTVVPMMGNLAARVIPTHLTPKQAVELGHAVLAVITGDTKTRAWLSQVAATFVSLCALGLHPEAQQELLDRLRLWSLIVDNHVVISFLCRGEDDHDGVKRILEAWRKLGREISTCDAVLEEAAYHAFIADRCYQEMWREFATMDKNAAGEAIRNAFVRSFFLLNVPGGFDQKRWQAYLFNYAGKDQFDCSKMKSFLINGGWAVVDDTQFPRAAVEQVQAGLDVTPSRHVRLNKSGGIERMRRNEWDARTALAGVHRIVEKQSSGGNVIIVTKSRAIRTACDWVGKTSPFKVSVMTVGALGYAMALTPGLSVSLVHIRDLLFNRHLLGKAFSRLESQARKLSDHDREEGFDLAGRLQLQERLRGAVADEFQRIDQAVGERPTLKINRGISYRSTRRRSR